MTDHGTDGGDRAGRRLDGLRTGWIALLARLDPEVNPILVDASYRDLVGRMKPTMPVGVDVELISPTTGEASQAGLVISSPDLALLRRWIEGEPLARTMRLLSETSQTPVTIVTQGGAPPIEFPVSYVVTYTVPVANRSRFEEWRPKIVAAHLDADGFVSAEYHAPLGVDEHGWTIIVRFATDDDLTSWRASERRGELLGQLDTIVDDLDVRRAGLSWAGWFPQPRADAPARPQRWKQALATVIPLYPTVMLATTHLGPRLGSDGWGWPGWLITFVTVTIAVATLTWLLMPTVTKVLSPWLLPAPGQRTRDNVAWTFLVAGILAALLIIFGATT